MTSDRHSKSNRRNAMRSTGPRTREGRENSARNATRHGVLARVVVTDPDERAAFDQLLGQLEYEHCPQTAIEYALVQRLATLLWRERRLVRSEAQLASLSEGELVQAAGGMMPAPMPLDAQLLIGRYQTMLSNQIAGALTQLHSLQDRRIIEGENTESNGG